MYFTDLIDVTQVDDIVKEYTVELARIMREKLDLLVRNVLNAGTNVMYAAGRTTRDTLVAGDKPTIADLRKGVLSFKRNHVKPAMGGKYVALVTPSVVHDLLDDPAFLKAYEIGQNNKPLIEGEIADVYGIKFIEVVNGFTVTNANATPATVHSTVLLGAGAYGITEINGEGGAKTIIKPLGSSGSDDPLNQRQSIGAKVNAFVAKRLEEQAILRYESVPTNQ